MRSILSLSLTLVGVAACGDATPPTLTGLKAAVFRPSCTNAGCHDATAKAGSLDLVTDPHAALVNKPAVQVTAAAEGLKLVVPGDPAKSFLYMKCVQAEVNDPKYGTRMPQSAKTLTTDQRTALESWIAEGAKND